MFVQQIGQRRPIVFAAVTHVGANLGLGPVGVARGQGLNQLRIDSIGFATADFKSMFKHRSCLLA